MDPSTTSSLHESCYLTNLSEDLLGMIFVKCSSFDWAPMWRASKVLLNFRESKTFGILMFSLLQDRGKYPVDITSEEGYRMCMRLEYDAFPKQKILAYIPGCRTIDLCAEDGKHLCMRGGYIPDSDRKFYDNLFWSVDLSITFCDGDVTLEPFYGSEAHELVYQSLFAAGHVFHHGRPIVISLSKGNPVKQVVIAKHSIFVLYDDGSMMLCLLPKYKQIKFETNIIAISVCPFEEDFLVLALGGGLYVFPSDGSVPYRYMTNLCVLCISPMTSSSILAVASNGKCYLVEQCVGTLHVSRFTDLDDLRYVLPTVDGILLMKSDGTIRNFHDNKMTDREPYNVMLDWIDTIDKPASAFWFDPEGYKRRVYF